MTGDPATQEWRPTIGKSTLLTRLRRVEAELRRVEAELGSALGALAQAREELAVAKGRDDRCAWRGLAEELLRERPGQVYPARQDVGICVLCGGQIVRGHWVEARQDDDPNFVWVHAAGVCPDKEN